jgi:aspartate/methionine/tyrosine aminotransferase
MDWRTITVGGFSKAYAMTGWRVGYLVAPPATVAAAARLKELWSGPTSQIAQHGALAALRGGPELVEEAVASYARRRAVALAGLRSFGLAHAPAQGAFYAFFDVASLGLSSYELSRRLLLEAGVFLYPGSGFGAEWRGHMRLAWLAPDDLLEQALTRMGDWIASHR